MNTLQKLLFIVFAIVAFGQMVWAQTSSTNLPAEVRANDATITHVGHATLTVEYKIVTDSLTRRTDTLRSVTNIEWDTPAGTAKRRNAEQDRGNNPNGSGFYNEGHSAWLDIYYYNYNYPSIDAGGKPVLLSAMASMPDEDCDHINNVIIGCHVTITSNKQCPSSYKDEGSKASDVGLLVNHSSSGMVFHSAQSDMAYYNLVILPDYEGYGLTRSHAHPYLYQELTARQVVDATRYGIALYKNSPTISSIRHNFRSGWRTISVGYSQGGSVALATHRFIEQNGLTDELNFAGSVCGDGPYDPIATLMYYVKQYNDRYVMSMPVVLPLILKGMCDSNPYMKNHQVSDYLSSDFLATGILGWLTEKEKTTDDITEAWLRYYLSHNDDQHVGPDGKDLYLDLGYILRQAGLGYFQNLYTANASTYTSLNGVPLPTQRGLMQDLHFALASNNLTKGWVPNHAVFLYHSYDDSVVPEVNRESAGNSFGQWAIKLHASGAGQFDHETTGIQFLLGVAEFEAIRHLAKAPVHQTMQHAIDMKNTISTGWHTIDPWDNPPVIHSNIVLAPLMLNGVEIQAEYKLEEGFAVLGTGYNACIPQYSEGTVEIPATITIGETTYNVDQISNVAFRMCNKITEVVVPENVNHIGNFAFQGCQALTKVTLPSTLVTIGSGAFIDLPNLTTIDMKATMPPRWQYNDVFKFHTGGIGDQTTYTYEIQLLVPEGSVSSYTHQYYTHQYYNDLGQLVESKPEGWGNFTNIGVGAETNAEAYATYSNGTLTFYYDTHRTDRQNNGLACYDLTPGLGGFPGWLSPNNSHANDITQVEFTPLFQYARPTTTTRWFNDCANLSNIIGMGHLRTDEVTDMSYMFHGCSSLEDDDLDFRQFNTASVTNMKSMFEDCVNIQQPDLSHFNTRSCTNMQNMFWGCTGLTSIDLSSFETTACDFNYMFHGCTNLETVSIGSFGAANTYVCAGMFENCGKLSSLTIPSAFNKYKYAFHGCTKIYDVYCYKPVPFEVWQGCDTDFDTDTHYHTRFHVLASALNAWETAYGQSSATPANVEFIGDLGTDTNPILIYGTVDWVNIGMMADNDVSVNAKMMNDIRVHTMLGSSNHPFKGTFDGNGHTLTVNYEITENASQDPHTIATAPFSVIRNAEIKNLKVKGNITATNNRGEAAGLVGWCKKNTGSESVNNLITNCHVSTHINGKIEHFGGIVCVVDDNVITTISGCLFDGYLAANHDYYLQQTIDAGAIVCTVGGSANISHCVESGSYENISQGHNVFCPTTITPTNSYYFTDGLQGHAKRAYSLTTDTEGLLLDFGTATATYDVSGITAYITGLKIDDVFHTATNQPIDVAITAPGYENLSMPTINGGATLTTNDQVHYTATLASANAVVSMQGLVFTTIVLYDDATDNSLTLEKYVDQRYKVQLAGHTIRKNAQWNTLCLPFDLPSLNGTPLQGARLKELRSITFENKVAVFHFIDATSISADKLYFVKVDNDVADPIFNNVTIKRSLPPGMKLEVGELTQSGFVAKGNYNNVGLVDFDEDGVLYTALYFDGTGLRTVSYLPRLSAFQSYFEVCLSLDDVVAIVLDIEGGRYFKTLRSEHSDIDNILISNGDWNDDDNWATGAVISGPAIDVLIEANATIPSGYTAEVNTITIDAGKLTIKDGGQLIHRNDRVQATVEKNITAFTNDDDGWNFIASPLYNDIMPTKDNGFITTNTYDLYYYDEPTHYWRNHKSAESNTDPGFYIKPQKGYLYASSDGTTLQFAGTLQHYVEQGIAIRLTHEGQGWNLVGNPFAFEAFADKPYYVINGRNVEASAGGAIPSCTGIVVKAENDYDYVRFTKDAPQQNANHGGFNIALTQQVSNRGISTSVQLDNAIVSFDEGTTLPKFRFGEHSEIYIPQGGEDYAIAYSEQQGEMPLNFKATKDGEYTLTVSATLPTASYLHLIDNTTGADIDLSQTPSYTFTGRNGDYESRFKLVFSTNNNHNGNEDFAFISNGNLIINGEGTLQVFDVLGHELLHKEFLTPHSSLSTPHFRPGVYVLRLINGDDVKTQKIVIK